MELGVKLSVDVGRQLSWGLAALFFAVALVFVWREWDQASDRSEDVGHAIDVLADPADEAEAAQILADVAASGCRELLVLGPAERAEVIIDFAGMHGEDIVLSNTNPPFERGLLPSPTLSEVMGETFLELAGKPMKTPFELLKTQHMTVQVKINGKGPYRLIFDTGAPVTLINNRIAKEAGVFPKDFRSVRSFAERSNNIVHWTEMPRGGHFAASEDPDLLVEDIRKFFGSLIVA